MTARAETVTLNLRVISRTNRACLVTADDEAEVWLPNSMIEDLPVCTGGLHDITIPEWLAIERGLV